MICDLNINDALNDIVEIYVVCKDFRWTHIKTHEGICGPYFMLKKCFFIKRII
ncbi:MAG: DUF4275 family protein [Ruminococcaceae bacterium]|nr:DUF4275 family protein [Oscillospiraceae bacterium]